MEQKLCGVCSCVRLPNICLGLDTVYVYGIWLWMLMINVAYDHNQGCFWKHRWSNNFHFTLEPCSPPTSPVLHPSIAMSRNFHQFITAPTLAICGVYVGACSSKQWDWISLGEGIQWCDVIVIVTRYWGLPQQAGGRLFCRPGLPREVSLRGHNSRLLQPETHQNTRSHSSVHCRTVSHSGFIWHKANSRIDLYQLLFFRIFSNCSLTLWLWPRLFLLFFVVRRLNNNDFTVLEATGIFKKLPQLRKMWVFPYKKINSLGKKQQFRMEILCS